MEQLCKAIDTAKTLRRSLRDDPVSTSNNKALFIEFLELEIPSPSQNGLNVILLDARSGKPVSYSFAGLIYAIRCMVHENENLNAAEKPDYHIQLDWTTRATGSLMGRIEQGRLICNGHMLWRRLREVLSKYIMGIEATIASAEGKACSVTIDPPFGSIRPFESSQ